MKLTWTCALIAALVATAGACAETFPEWNRGRNFSVRVTMDGTPVQRMRVLLTPEDERKKSDQVETTSDDNGVARFAKVKPGTYYVEAIRQAECRFFRVARGPRAIGRCDSA